MKTRKGYERERVATREVRCLNTSGHSHTDQYYTSLTLSRTETVYPCYRGLAKFLKMNAYNTLSRCDAHGSPLFCLFTIGK